MKWNFKRELARKFVHFVSLLVLFVYFMATDIFSERIALIILVFILIVFLEFEYLRLEVGKKVGEKVPILKNIWQFVRRDKEKNKLGGDIFFLIGAVLVLAVFDTEIAMAAILMTIFGDISAAVIGSTFGKHYLKHFRDKTWEGVLAEFFVNVVIGIVVFFLVLEISFYSGGMWLIVFVMSLTATFVETVTSKVDDNLLIPLFSGFNGQIVLLLVNYFNGQL